MKRLTMTAAVLLLTLSCWAAPTDTGEVYITRDPTGETCADATILHNTQTGKEYCCTAGKRVLCPAAATNDTSTPSGTTGNTGGTTTGGTTTQPPTTSCTPGVGQCCPTSGIAAKPCGTEGVCDDATTLLCESWEDGDHKGWDWNSTWDAPPAWYQIAGAGGYNSANALRMRIPARTSSTSGSDDTIYPGASNSIPRGTTIYVRWFAKWSPGFVYMPDYGDGQKHAYLTQYGDRNTTVRIMIQAPSSADRTKGRIVNSLGDSHGNTRYYNGAGAEPFIVPDRWYCIETMVKPGTYNVADGALSIWLDGQAYMTYSNVLVNTCVSGMNGDCAWRSIPFLTSYYGGNPGPTHPEQYVSYDNVVVSTARIGCGQ